MVVDMQLCDEKGERIHLDEEPCVLFNDKNHIYDGILISLAKKSNTIGPFDWLERLYLSFKLLCQIARDTTSTEVEDDLIKKGVTYLENNYTQNFNVDILADMCAISPGYFRKLFNECKGTSPTDYRNRLRIQYASELLKKGAHTVGEAAELVGISDIKYFSKLFVRYTGIKPSEFKKQSFIKK